MFARVGFATSFVAQCDATDSIGNDGRGVESSVVIETIGCVMFESPGVRRMIPATLVKIGP